MENMLKKYLRGRKIVKIAVSLFLIGITINLFQVFSLNQLISEDGIEYEDNIDIVYTWVNGSDEKFIEAANKYQKHIDRERYENNDEIKYSLRSLELNAPWLRHVYIVTNGQIPNWLNLDYEKVSIIPHDQLVKEPGILPTFSSNVIEQFLHLIPNLSKRFLYLNDDIFFGAELYPEDLYTTDRGIHVYTTKDAPECAPLCPWSRIKDEICDKECNVPECEFDGNDCVEGNKLRDKPSKLVPDSFSRSIINSSKMFNLAYGLKKRYILPHTGFLFDKDIMKNMFMKFRKEFNNTRYNRFRTMDDVQVGYSFAHYLMSETRSVSAEEIFDRFDLDKSGILSDNEISSLLEELYLKNTNSARDFERLLLKCFKDTNERIDGEDMEDTFSKNSNSRKVTRNLVNKCSPLNEILVKRFSVQSKYKFEVTNVKGYINSFILLTSNITQVTNVLNMIKKYPKKFSCIGETQNQKMTEGQRLKVKEALDNFYTTVFPYRSKFELPEFVQNPFLYYDEYLIWKYREQFRSVFSVTSILCTLIISCILICCIKLKCSRK